MTASRINRAQFLRRAAALGLFATTTGITTAATASAVRPNLELKGVAYDTGTGFVGDDSRMLWRNSIMRGEIHAIRHRLHANWVSIYGSDVRRLTDTATAALEQGLTVSIQPRSFDEPQADELEKLLRKVAVEAERLRRRYDQEVILVIGCEFMLFTPGIVPGATFFERVEYLTKGEFDMAELQRKFRAFTARMVKVARSNFKGRITYGAASDLERVDWSLFDLVGLDYYSYHADRAGQAGAVPSLGQADPDPGVRVLHLHRRSRAGRHGVGHRRLQRRCAGDPATVRPRRTGAGRPPREHARRLHCRGVPRRVAVHLHLTRRPAPPARPAP
ncbi:hypothetical protein OG558_08135 [Kribbella sp. NBC_01510]|uniref:hypothetical protein n=1 Tax=Kribbella sp. NBC_01510 TaxID=2903581 RepID=UPI003869CDDB